MNALADTAVHFNGVNDYVNASDPSLFDFTTNSFSINVWLLPYTSDAYLMGNNTYQQCGWYMCLSGDHIMFGADSPGAEYSVDTVQPIQFWPWNDMSGVYTYGMISITRQGTNAPLIYWNGRSVETDGTYANPASSTNGLVFGIGTTEKGDIPYDGNMWQPQIWSQALTGQQILTLYSNQIAGTPWP